MSKATTLNGHALGKYETEDGESHLGRNIAIGGGILGAAVGAFLGYKALTNNNPRNTAEEVQKALSNPKAQTQVMEDPRQYHEQALAEFNKTGRVSNESRTVYGHELPAIGYKLSDYTEALNQYLKLSPKLEQVDASEISSVKKIPKDDFEKLLREYRISKKEFLETFGEVYLLSVLSDKNPYAEGKYFMYTNKNGELDVIMKRTAGFNVKLK